MTTRSIRRPIVGGVLGVVLAISATWLASVALAGNHAVKIVGFAFAPQTVTVSVGDTVTWTNGDSVTHTASAIDASFDTGQIPGGTQSSPVTFNTAGTFAYHCRIHSAMTATIVVSNATPPPTDTLDPAAARTDTTPWALLLGAALGGLVIGRRRFGRSVEAPSDD